MSQEHFTTTSFRHLLRLLSILPNHCHSVGIKNFQFSRVSKSVLSLAAGWFKDGFTMEKVRSNINAMNLNVRDKFVPSKTLR